MKKICLLLLVPALLTAAGLQKMNLYDTATPRFSVTDRVWPAVHGEADVCLWAGDKIAAASFSIDDNFVGDHPWWKAQGEKYGWQFTWFIMPDQLNAAGWASFRDLHAAGHDLQLHNTCDINNFSDADYIAQIESNITSLETNVPGAKALTYAYPCGTDKSAVIKDHFIAARGVFGTPNAANKIDYLNTSSAKIDSCWVQGVLGDPSGCSKSWQINGINSGTHTRSWLSAHYHGEGGTGAEKIIALDLLKNKEDDIWVGSWTAVAKYGQERDTHELTVTSVAADAVVFTLSDDMKDDLFDEPLTVKIRVNNDWQFAAAVQDGAGRMVTVVEHDGNKYALVDAVPDRGAVTVTKADASGIKDGRQGLLPSPGSDALVFNAAGRSVGMDNGESGMYFIYDGTELRKLLNIQ